MDTIGDDAAATAAATLVQAVTLLKVERQRQLGAMQEDPERDVRDTYVRMLRFVRSHGASNPSYAFRES